MAPRAVLMTTGLKSVNTASPVNTVRSVNTGRPFSTARSFNTVRPSYTAHPKSTVHCARPRTYFQNQAQSSVHMPFYKRTTLTKRCYNQRFNTWRQNCNTVRHAGFNASISQLNDKGFVDSGCSRHMTGNIAHLSNFKDFDGGYVTFRGGAYGSRINIASPKKTAWEQFSSNIATAVICLATNRRFNFSRLIFEHMMSNISSPHMFLMYPRFIQICLDMQRKQLQQHSRTYPVPSISIKVFNNMKRPTKGYSGQEVDLFPTMLNVFEPSTSPSRITSSPSHSHEPSIEHSLDHTTDAVSFPSPTQPTQPSPRAEQHISTPYDSPLHVVHSHGSDGGSLQLIELTNLVTKLSERIGRLKSRLGQQGKELGLSFMKMMKMLKMILPNKGGNNLMQRFKRKQALKPNLSIQDTWTPTEVIQDQGSSEKGNSEVSTAGATKGTTSEVPVSLSQDEREPEPVKKSKKLLEQERLGLEEAIRLQEKVDEEERAQVVRDKEIARQLLALDEERVTTDPKTTKDID
ncbi:hypothetical protein Tco_1203718 [Tanacetum coccineum]